MYCGNCGKEIKETVNFCPYCGKKVIEDASKNEENHSLKSENDNNSVRKDDKTTPKIIKFLIFLLILLSLIIVGAIIKTATSPIINGILKGVGVKAHDCESEEVKNLAINIFKQHNGYYAAIEDSSIANIELKYPAKQSYDASIDKYSCQGEVVMTSTNDGFIPTEYNIANSYYRKIGREFKTQYICKIEYSSQLSEGKTLVYSDYCSGGDGDFE